MPSRRLGILKVDLGLLAALLRLPEGVRIVRATRPRPGVITNGEYEAAFVLEGDHPGLYDVPEGAAVIPFVRLELDHSDQPGRITQ